MSYEIRAFCRPVCDQPGCDAMVEDMDVNWFSDTGYAEDVAAEWDWQTIGDDVMHTRHYCPLHIHAKCMECGRRENPRPPDVGEHRVGGTERHGMHALPRLREQGERLAMPDLIGRKEC